MSSVAEREFFTRAEILSFAFVRIIIFAAIFLAYFKLPPEFYYQNKLLIVLICEYLFFNSTHPFVGFIVARYSDAYKQVIAAHRSFYFIAAITAGASALVVALARWPSFPEETKEDFLYFLYRSLMIWHLVKQAQGISILLDPKMSKNMKQIMTASCTFLFLGLFFQVNTSTLLFNIKAEVAAWASRFMFIGFGGIAIYFVSLFLRKNSKGLLFSSQFALIAISGLSPFMLTSLRILHGLESIIFYRRFALSTISSSGDKKRVQRLCLAVLVAMAIIPMALYFLNFRNALWIFLTINLFFNWIHFVQETFFYRTKSAKMIPMRRALHPASASLPQ